MKKTSLLQFVWELTLGFLLLPLLGWGYDLMPITFSGYTRSETLTNFPALATFSNYTGFLSSSGYDLRFWTNSTAVGTPLNYEIENWTNSGTSYVWVQVPVLTNNTTIWATWGNASDYSQQAYTTNGATWTANYGAVWHMTAPKDSSTNLAALTLTGSSLAAGMIGSSVALTGTTPYVSSPASITNFPLTMSVWYKFNSTNWGNNTGPILISAYNPAISSQFWTDWYLSGGAYSFRNVAQGGGTYVGSYSSTPDTNTWHFLESVFPSAGTSQLYVDGKLVTWTGSSGSVTPTGISKFSVGGIIYNGSSWYDVPVNGLEDEARFSSVARGTNWIWAEYQNMASNTVFNSYGVVTIRPDGVRVFFR